MTKLILKTDFERDLAALIDKHSLETPSNTPDFILARYVVKCLEAYNEMSLALYNHYASGGIVTELKSALSGVLFILDEYVPPECFKNGVEHQGIDEGEVRSGEIIEEARQILLKYSEGESAE